MPASKFQPALYGGLLLGVLSALPIVGAGNLCCCLWVIAGGVVAAYVLQNNQPTPISLGDGAVVGLLAGLIGAVLWQAIAVPIALVLGPLQARVVERVLSNASDLPENVRPLLDMLRESSAGGGLMLLGIILGLMFKLVIAGIFSTVGGLIGAAIFAKKPAAGANDGL